MKKLAIKLISIYQKIPGIHHNYCKYVPTCSEYAKIAISRFGFFKGMFYSIKRILRCNPFAKGGIDLVPERRNKV